LSATTWLRSDVSNPAPPAGHTAADGYIFTTLQQGGSLTESGYLQVVGGDGTDGDSRLTAVIPLARGDGYQRFEMDVYPQDIANVGRVGIWDPTNVGALAGEVYGIKFNAGTIYAEEAGVQKVSLNTVTYVATTGACYRVRIIPNITTGAEYWVNSNYSSTPPFQGSSWVHLYTSVTGSQALLTIVPAFNKNFSYRVGRCKVLKRLYNFSVTVGGVAKTVGILNVDADGGLDAVIGTEAGNTPVLAFYGDTTPANAAAIIATYYESIPIMVQADDIVSQATIKALENPSNLANGSDGIYEGYIDDSLIDTLARGILRASTQLTIFSSPLINATVDTNNIGLAAGQMLPIILTKAISGRDVNTSLLIQAVTTTSLGSGNYKCSIVAGSRLLKDSSEYIIDLMIAAKSLDATQSYNTPLDQTVTATDLMALSDAGIIVSSNINSIDGMPFTDIGSIAAGPLPPYYYTDAIDDEVSGSLMCEDDTLLITEENLHAATQYGLAAYQT
jgi:hypothetical protein